MTKQDKESLISLIEDAVILLKEDGYDFCEIINKKRNDWFVKVVYSGFDEPETIFDSSEFSEKTLQRLIYNCSATDFFTYMRKNIKEWFIEPSLNKIAMYKIFTEFAEFSKSEFCRDIDFVVYEFVNNLNQK